MSSRRFEGKSALVTGAGRGQGRAHALGLAAEGANVAICDIGGDIATVPYGLSTPSDLEQTAERCRALGARVVADTVDVRDYDQLKAFADRAIAELGQIHVLVPNAGIFTFSTLVEMPEEKFDDMIDVNLKGVWHAFKAVVPHMVEHQYGRVVVTSSGAGLIAYPNVGHYVASKHAVIGLTKTLALEHAADGITANCVCPTTVHTPMLENEAAYELMNPGNPTLEGALETMNTLNPIPVPWIEPEEVTKLVLFLASDDSRYITGAEMKIDAGITAR